MEYPSQEQLVAIETFEGNPAQIAPLVEAAYNHHYGHMVIENGRDIMGRQIRRMILVTGGWSGNEDIVAALCDNRLFYMRAWRSSERGGRHVFEWKARWESTKVGGI